MSKTAPKKTIDRRKRARTSSKGSKASSRRKQAKPAANNEESCFHCSKDLRNEEKALFVEEELSRIFCTESCIAAYFGPDIERLEKEYFKHLSSGDLNVDDREKFAHLRWITLEEADEVWREKTLSGDYRYTLISEFKPGSRPIWCVCICLFLRGEPSFLFLAFPTKNQAMVAHYRRGERVQWMRDKTTKKKSKDAREMPEEVVSSQVIDGLADEWTEEESLRAQHLNNVGGDDDIPSGEYGLYESCLNETLEVPDEVWSPSSEKTDDALKLYHFIRHYPEEESGVWFVIVARETEDAEEIEILDAFPTKDARVVDRYRNGTQEVGSAERNAPSRLVH